jgi:hypothetical protein
LAAVEEVYAGECPDLVEVPDRHAVGLMLQQARRCGSPSLARTLIVVRLTTTFGIDALHDGRSAEGDNPVVAALERQQLLLADILLWPGGDGLEQYREFYGLPLEEALVAPDPYPPSTHLAGAGQEGPLRVAFIGPVAQRTGALALAEACLRLPIDDWTLTFAGHDTDTAPAGESAQLTIEWMFAGDTRVKFLDSEIDTADLAADHDVAVVAPRGGAWFDGAVDALRAGLPILATPVGGLTALVEAGGGWLAVGREPADLRAALCRLSENLTEVRSQERREQARTAAQRFVDPEAARVVYGDLIERQGRRRTAGTVPAPAAEPLVTGIIPYYRASAYIRGAVESLLSQTHRNLEVVIVNDGSFHRDDSVLSALDDDPRVRVVTQLNRGDGGARNLGLQLARGEFVALLDADNEMEEEFVERALGVFRAEPDLAYVSCWLRFVDRDGMPHNDPAGYAALGNGVVPGNELNWDGDTLALLPRAIFSEFGYRFEQIAGMYSDWELYRRLHRDGRFGTVIPEYLASYRFVPDSVSRGSDEDAVRRSVAAARDRLRASATRWEGR